MNNLTILVMIIGSLRINASVLTHYFDFKYNPERLHDYLGNLLRISLIMGFLFTLLMMLIGPTLFQLIFKTEAIAFYPYGILAIGIGVLWNFISPYFIFLKNERVLFKYAVLYVLLVVVNVAMHLLLIIGLELGIEGALWAKFLANALLVLIIMTFNFPLLMRQWKKYYLTKALQFSVPLLPFLIINWLQLYGDRFVLERYLDLKAVGIYSLLITLVSLLPLALDAVINGIRPFLFDYFADDVQRNLKGIHQLYRFYFTFCLFTASGIILVGANIHLFTSNQDYLQILPYLTVATMIFFLRCYTSIFFLNLLFLKQSKILSFLSIGLAVVLLLCLFLLIPIWGIWGAIIANLAGNLFMLFALGYTSQQKFYIPLPVKSMIYLPILILFLLFAFDRGANLEYWSYPMMGVGQFLLIGCVLLVYNRQQIQKFILSRWPFSPKNH